MSRRANSKINMTPSNGQASNMTAFSFVDGCTQPSTKRKRTITSCAPCRKKKVKCDKQRPVCGYCKKANGCTRCEYPEPSWEDSNGEFTTDYQKAASVPLAHINIEKIVKPTSGKSSSGLSTASLAKGLSSNLTRRKSSADLQNTFQVKQSQVQHPPQSLPQQHFSGGPNYQQSFPQNSFNNRQDTNSYNITLSDFAPLPLQNQQFQYQQKFRQVDYTRAVSGLNPAPGQKLALNHVESNIRGSPLPPIPPRQDNPHSLSFQRQQLFQRQTALPTSRRSPNSRHSSVSSQVEGAKRSDTEVTNPSSADEDSLNENKPKQSLTFYDFSEPVIMRAGRLVAPGPLSLVSLLKKDPFLLVILCKIRKDRAKQAEIITEMYQTHNLVGQIILGAGNKGTGVDDEFQKKLIANEQIEELNDQTIVTATTTITSGNSKNGNIRKTILRSDPHLRVYEVQDEHLRSCVIALRPLFKSRKLIWTLFDRFFSCVLVGAMPYSLQRHLMMRLELILGLKSLDDSEDITVKIEKRFDFAYIGQLFYIMRITYLSVVKHDQNTEEEKYILANPVGQEFVNAAQLCLNQFKILRRGAIPIILNFLLMRSYSKYAPEDGDSSDGGDSQVFLGMAIQMMNSIGLNRDHSHVKQFEKNPPFINLTRLLWHEMLTVDTTQAMTFGSPTLIDTKFSDTKLPELYTRDGMDADKQLGYADYESYSAIVSNFQIGDELNKASRDIIDIALRIDRAVELEDLLPKLHKLEETMVEVGCGSLKTVLDLPFAKNEDAIKKYYKFSRYLELKSSLFVIYYHIYSNDSTHHKKMFVKMIEIAQEITPLALLLTTANNGKVNLFEKVFGTGAQIIIIPGLISAIHKLNQIYISILCRCLDVRFNYRPKGHRATLFKKIYDIATYYFRIWYDGLKNLSSTYFQAWRAIKGTTYIYKMITTKENNMWDRSTTESVDFSEIGEEFNHYKIIPEANDLETKSDQELEAIIATMYSKSYIVDVVDELKAGFPEEDQRTIENIYKLNEGDQFQLGDICAILNLVMKLGKDDDGKAKNFNDISVYPPMSTNINKFDLERKASAKAKDQTQQNDASTSSQQSQFNSAITSNFSAFSNQPERSNSLNSNVNTSTREVSPFAIGSNDGMFADEEVDQLWLNSIVTGKRNKKALNQQEQQFHEQQQAGSTGGMNGLISDGQPLGLDNMFEEPSGVMPDQSFQQQEQSPQSHEQLIYNNLRQQLHSQGLRNPTVLPISTDSNDNSGNLQRFTKDLTTNELQNLMTNNGDGLAANDSTSKTGITFSNPIYNNRNQHEQGYQQTAGDPLMQPIGHLSDLGGDMFDQFYDENNLLSGGMNLDIALQDITTFGFLGS